MFPPLCFLAVSACSRRVRIVRRGVRPMGSALIIVLAFIVLLTGLVVAFLSRALSERQISNSSASEAKVELFAEGAISTIVGDLKSEIAAGSNMATPPPGFNLAALTTPVYTPKTAATTVPQRVPTPAPAAVDDYPNLVKISAYDSKAVPFYKDSPTTPFGADGPARAVNSSSDTPSQNGRFVSAKRWNSHYLLPKQFPTSDTDATPKIPTSGTTGNGKFVVPKWILAADDGTNPTTVPTNTDPATAPTAKPRPVVGRFAYAIYDEGGLLDINAAGFPDPRDPLNPSQIPPPMPLAQTAYKASMAFADLSQLTDASNNRLLTNAQIDALTGRRSFVSSSIDPATGTQTPLAGDFPNFNWTSTNQTNYFLFNLADTSGFLSPSKLPPLNSRKNAYDRRVITRQEMLNLMLRGVVIGNDPTPAVQRANIQNALQYLTSYSRSLNQPSYAPVSRAASGTNPNPRPAIQRSTAGGNNVGDSYSGAAQDALSPNFLTLRAQAAFTRSDNTKAVIGEPLVLRRFALQRLAWLTYKGPSADRTGVTGGSPTDVDTKALLANGVPIALLQQGNGINIQKYFGLSWDGTRWAYKGHNRVTNGTADAPAGAIHQLPEIAALKTREPDFFELLKASVDPGAVAKASTNSPTADADGLFAPLNIQYTRDISFDAAIIQMGANIIDQFDTDGYATRIIFDDGSGKQPREFRGVENLPYIYRVHPGVLKAREAIPTSLGVTVASADLHSGTAVGYTAKPLLDTGVGILLSVPDLWNPHDQNGSLGNPRPGANIASFRVIANSAAPDYIGTSTVNTIAVGGYAVSDPVANARYRGASCEAPGNGGGGALSTTSVTPNAPGFSRTPTPVGGPGTPMTGTNSGYINSQMLDQATGSTLAFNIPDGSFFREPTLLGTPNVAGTGLSMTISNQDVTKLLDGNGAAVYTFTTAGGNYYGLRSPYNDNAVNANPFFMTGGVASPTQPQLYTGLYMGVYPLRWVGGRWSTSDRNSTGWVYTDAQMGVIGSPVDGVTYSVQYQDEAGTWITYDEKYINTKDYWVLPMGALIQPNSLCYTFADPRTSRFGAPVENNFSGGNYKQFYRAPAVTANWLDSVNGVSGTERADYHSGFGGNFRGGTDWGYYAAPGWHYKNVGMATAGGLGTVFYQTGLLAQNNPYWIGDGKRFNNDNPTAPSSPLGTTDPEFYTDPDGVVRRAMGAHIPQSADNASANPTTFPGQPLATASIITNGKATPIPAVNAAPTQSTSRPKVLNRPFRSVAELGSVFSGTPWKNLDFSTAESGFSELLDVFSVSDTDDALVAGRLNLNTRQPMVLKAMLAGAATSEPNATPSPLSADDAKAVADLLVARTSQQPKAGPNVSKGPQPLGNIGDLAGRWNSRQIIGSDPLTPASTYTPALDPNHNIDGKFSYDGLSLDFNSLLATNALCNPIAALRETAARSLASVGNTRVWNLMIDLVAQTGRYPAGASSVDKFIVEGEQRCWVHLAIDRSTGEIIDRKLEIVKE